VWVLKFVQFACLALALSIGIVSAQAVTPSPAMIEQFKKLPRAEQERLARQYGYNLPRSSGSSSTGSTAAVIDTEQQNLEPLPLPQADDIRVDTVVQDKPSRFGLAMFSNTSSNF